MFDLRQNQRTPDKSMEIIFKKKLEVKS